MRTNAAQATKTSAPKTVALAFFNAIEETLIALYGRWLDEREHEDINDYRKPFEGAAAKHGVSIVKMTKRPFGMVFTTDLGTYAATVNGSSVSYKRIS